MTKRRPCGHSYIMPKTTIALPQDKGTKYDKHNIHPSSACSGITGHQRIVYILFCCTKTSKSEKNDRKVVYERKIM